MNDVYQYNVSLKKKIAIWGTGKESLEFAISLINHNIRFDYFIYEGDAEIEPTYLLNKKVIQYKDVLSSEKQDIAVTINPKQKLLLSEDEKYRDIINLAYDIQQLNDDLVNKEVIIYGASEEAKKFIKIYGTRFQYMICDSDERRWGEIFCGKRIITPEELRKSCKEKEIVICSYSFIEIEQCLMNIGVDKKKIYIDRMKYVDKDRIHIADQCYFGSKTSHSIAVAINAICRKNKKIVFYGQNELIESIVIKLKLLDINQYDLVRRNSKEEDGTILNLPFEEDENVEYILLDNYKKNTVRILKENRKELSKYRWLENYSPYYTIDWDFYYQKVMDPLLGYITIGEEKYPGIVEYKWINSKNEKPVQIMTLGNSTTTAHWVQSSWSKELSILLKKRNISHIIYCAGIEAYNSSQELLLLIRDGLRIKLDMVLCMDGINELDWMKVKGHAFFNRYFSKYNDVAENMKLTNKNIHYNYNYVNYGLNDIKSNMEMWYDNVMMMHAICISKNICYQAFIQPTIFNKAIMQQDRNHLAILGVFEEKETKKLIFQSETAHIYQEQLSNLEQAKKVTNSMISDLSHIFDNEDGCFMDECHTYINGNRLIAKAIFNNIEERLYKIIKKYNGG